MESVIDKIILALFVPGLLVVLFTRITYNHIVALLLSIALIAASVYAGYSTPAIVFVADALSLTVGFWYATRTMNRAKTNSDGD
ncbi:CsbA family protein [Ureibacillus acetophenoni]|uniref:General stress protein CsbA n=1 Tax=Ureibacillus acetophenoni TaxID=614649 RepID=A0A285TZN2_9BACL|nr:CsbA family protein [Ureibacillus acetophenoni]SOC35032.1 general stress protein CsbA [Ureibacillus acetophenoni]